MMKKISVLYLVIIVMLVFSGCTRGSQVTVMSKEHNTSTMMSMTYKKFSGYKETNVTVKEGEPVKIDVNIVTKDGTISAYIAKDDDKTDCSYEGNDIQTSTFTITLSDPGKYTIRVDAKNHSGSYEFSWEK